MISNPAYLSLDSCRIKITQKQISNFLPVEDLACIVLDNPQITVTNGLLSLLSAKNIALIIIGDNHVPNGVLLSYLPHSRQNLVIKQQINATRYFNDVLWQFIIQQKIINQALVCEKLIGSCANLYNLAANVSIGDKNNHEAEASRKYFLLMFGKDFTRNCDDSINALLNYGYSVVRSLIARVVVAAGLLPTFGIHHDNELNAFNLVDDLIEPYRGFIDWYITAKIGVNQTLNARTKGQVIDILYHLIIIDNKSMTILNSIQVMVNSYVLSIKHKKNCLLLPQIPESIIRINLD
ncbi:MAG: type II CRISPR-associated endonuclease Cas1 [Burkholderiales bacterium]|nr:type II CRISPR-associated endonuclease Cas1 [Burkholderiales bacterium]